MKDRIKEIRQHVSIDMSQEAFGSKLGVTGAAISRIEAGSRKASDQIILAICREFNVNEEWLRTGKEPMFIEQTNAEEIDSFIKDILQGEPDFRRRVVSVLSRMTQDEWRLLEKKAYELLAELNIGPPAQKADENRKTSPAPKLTAEEEYEKSLGFAPSGGSSASNTTSDAKKNPDKEAI